MKRLLEHYGGAALLVTHNRDEAYDLCGQIALMDAGSLFAPKPTKELFADPGSITGAAITGCKNITAAAKTGEHEVAAPDWGIRLVTAQSVQDNVCAVGIRAHYFSPHITHNRFPVRFTDDMEEPFEYILQFRYENQADDAPDLWWQIPKEARNGQLPAELGIAPENVLLLYENEK
jgi:molybdate transport system ATP-binding protein